MKTSTGNWQARLTAEVTQKNAGCYYSTLFPVHIKNRLSGQSAVCIKFKLLVYFGACGVRGEAANQFLCFINFFISVSFIAPELWAAALNVLLTPASCVLRFIVKASEETAKLSMDFRTDLSNVPHRHQLISWPFTTKGLFLITCVSVMHHFLKKKQRRVSKWLAIRAAPTF